MKNELKKSHHRLDGDVQKIFAVGGAEESGWDSRLDWLRDSLANSAQGEDNEVGEEAARRYCYYRTSVPGCNRSVHACIELVDKTRISYHDFMTH